VKPPQNLGRFIKRFQLTILKFIPFGFLGAVTLGSLLFLASCTPAALDFVSRWRNEISSSLVILKPVLTYEKLQLCFWKNGALLGTQLQRILIFLIKIDFKMKSALVFLILFIPIAAHCNSKFPLYNVDLKFEKPNNYFVVSKDNLNCKCP
jgi:hypothetical protein